MKRLQQLAQVIPVLKSGGVAVLRTDTIYGILGKAHDQQCVERIFSIKGRDEGKSPIVLIAGEGDFLGEVPETVMAVARDFLYLPRTTVIIPCHSSDFGWITRGNSSIAYRIPYQKDLQSMLKETGPLIAPSANPQSSAPAKNIKEAIEYFGEKIDAYVDGGRVTDNTPSTIIKINRDGSHLLLRGSL